MATNAKLAMGTIIKRGAGSPVAFTTIPGVKSIQAPSLRQDFVDVTDLDSPGGEEEFIPSMLRKGNVQLNMNFAPEDARMIAFKTSRDGKLLEEYVIVFPTANKYYWRFSAYVEEIAPQAQVGGVLEATVSLKVSGAITDGLNGDLL